MIVTDLQGGCAHAVAFGELERQTLEAGLIRTRMR
jgi:hypothetical protein